eukprot:1787942-Alexandrium_andersonii.AAC.1
MGNSAEGRAAAARTPEALLPQRPALLARQAPALRAARDERLAGLTQGALPGNGFGPRAGA